MAASPPAVTAQDRLSAVLERFRVRAHLFFNGALCGVTTFDEKGRGFLHVMREGEMEITHSTPGLPRRLRVTEPTLLFYPRHAVHRFHNPPAEGSQFTCATLEFAGGAMNPIARALPPLIALPLARVQGLSPALSLLFAETEQVRCGQRLLADRLFEVVLIQLLRWLLDHPEEASVKAGLKPGLITGLSDPRLARALIAMHEAPGDTWNLERMAQCAGMSRSAFAAAFREIVGQTPADYLAAWRVSLAQARLREGTPVKLLADELGYANPSALSRAFQAKVGLSPREWLRGETASDAETRDER
ncbi:AraC family transcriptional regulator [Cupriavidus plantarum]|uniref:AraC family transcriptional regulator n=1 Tax=Cupriavidus plantarum TaxID=942865 RepID=UPI000E274208|nr:AraC family transcriptional regulator [Cupriavidus plantarum]NYI01105.1 AraC-like DNA-binding protein [Cupriavidus plantarum]REE93968.1 AraC family transcriptional regulator [Cupriavidus plantarum]